MTKRRIPTDVRAVLDQLDEAGDRAVLAVDGYDVSVTSLDKPLWPGAGRRPGATKRDLLRYFTRVSPYMLPHLADRPLFATRFPDGVTGKIFFDYNQNSRGKSLATPYSPRRHPAATVSMPISWDELETVYPTDFTLHTVPDRLDAEGDAWAGMLEARQDLAEVVGAGSAG